MFTIVLIQLLDDVLSLTLSSRARTVPGMGVKISFLIGHSLA